MTGVGQKQKMTASERTPVFVSYVFLCCIVQKILSHSLSPFEGAFWFLVALREELSAGR